MDDPRCVDGATTEAGHPVTSIDTVILSDKVLHTVTADVDPSAVEDACISSDGFVATTVGHQTLSDMGPAAVASGREELDIRMKLLAESQDKEEALKRNKATKGFKVSLRQCLKQKAGADTVVPAKQKRNSVGAKTVVQKKQKYKAAGADTVVQAQPKRKPVGVAAVVQGKKRHRPQDIDTVVPAKQKHKSVGAAAVVHKKQKCKAAGADTVGWSTFVWCKNFF